jgi:translocation and assembly module TamA
MGQLLIYTFPRKNNSHFFLLGCCLFFLSSTQVFSSQEAYDSELDTIGSQTAFPLGDTIITYDVIWKGISPELRSFLQPYVDFSTSGKEGLSESDIELLIDESPAIIQEILKTQGYFNAHVDIQPEQTKNRQYTIDVDLGPKMRIENSILRLVGPIQKQEDFSKIMNVWQSEWPLPLGGLFTSDLWISGKAQALRLIQKDRFPLATIAVHKAELDSNKNQGDLYLTVDSGPLVRFGKMSVEGLQRYPESVVRGLANFREGDPFLEERILSFQAALEGNGHFDSVIINQAFSENMNQHGESVVDIHVKVSELPRQKVDFGILWDQEEGIGARGKYSHYNIFKRGWIGDILFDVRRYNTKVGLGVAIPRNADGYSYLVTLVNEHQKPIPRDNILDDIKTVGASLLQLRLRNKIEASWGVEFLKEQTKRNDLLTQDISAVLANFSWKKDSVDRKIRPRNGYEVDFNISSTFGTILSKNKYARFLGKAAYWWSPTPKSGTFFMKGSLGEVWSDDPRYVPTSKLFLAGGFQSIRGYGLNSITAKGNVRGTRMLVGTIAYEHPIFPDWGAVIFSDIGSVTMRRESFNWNASYGVGLHWYNALAPVQFDFAKGIKDSRRFRWYLGVNVGL